MFGGWGEILRFRARDGLGTFVFFTHKCLSMVMEDVLSNGHSGVNRWGCYRYRCERVIVIERVCSCWVVDPVGGCVMIEVDNQTWFCVSGRGWRGGRARFTGGLERGMTVVTNGWRR